MSEIIKTIKSTVKHWYIPFIIGLMFITVGIWTIFSPLESYLALAWLFIISFIISGIFEIYFALSNKDELDHWGWELVNGLFGLIIGVVMLLNPELSILTLPMYIGFVVLFRSFMAISSSIELKKYGVLDWGNLMGIGILGTIFGFILLWNPLFAGLTLVAWTGIAMITIGGYGVYFAIKLKKLKNINDEITE